MQRSDPPSLTFYDLERLTDPLRCPLGALVGAAFDETDLLLDVGRTGAPSGKWTLPRRLRGGECEASTAGW